MSSKSQEDNFSLKSQETNCRDYAARQGYTVDDAHVYREVASGFSLNRPVLEQLREAIRRGAFHAVIVNSFDRWTSDDKDAYSLYVDLEAGTVTLESVTQGRFVDTEIGRLVMNAYNIGRQLWRKDHVERTTRGLRTKAENGMVIGSSRAPYGYRFVRRELPNGKLQIINLEEHPIDAAIVRRIFRELPSRSTLEIAAELNAEGEPSPTGRAWRQSTINKIARNSVYIGEWTYTSVRVPVPPLVSRAQWDAAQTGMADRYNGAVRRGRQARPDDPFILRGRLRCGHSGGMMKTDVNNSRRYYMCGCHVPSGAARRGKPVCDLPAVNAIDVEAALWQTLTATLLDPDVLAAGLAAAQTARIEADATHAARLAVIDQHLKEHRRRVSSMIDELIEAGPEAKAALRAKIAEQERLIAKCERERGSIANARHDSLNAEDADAIAAFAAQARDGIEAATPTDHRALYDLLRIHGTVRIAAPGQRRGVVKLGRIHRYVVDWTSAIPLSINGHRSFAWPNQ